LRGLGVEIVASDLSDPGLAERMRGCDALFHVAALYSLWRADRGALHVSNVLGTRAVLAAARAAGVPRAVYTSSVSAIGVKADGAADETYQSPPERLVGNYKRSKYFAEREALAAARAGQDVVIVNPSTPIGPYDVKPTPTGDIIARFLRGGMGPFYVETGLNFVDVRDVALGHLLAFERGRGGERYILGGENLAMSAFLALVAEAAERPAPRIALPAWFPVPVAWLDEVILGRLGKRPSVPLEGVRMAAQRMFYDAGKARRELGFAPGPVARAVRDAVGWYLQAGAAGGLR
jgi:dihydroflavonol-4-reductase